MSRRKNILNSGKSPSDEAMRRTYTRAQLNGGVTQDFIANTENIREMSRALGTNVLRTPAQINLVQFNEAFDNPYWAKVNMTITTNTAIAPDGTMTADSFMETTSAANKYIHLTQGFTVANTTPYVWSVYIKTNGRQWVLVDAFNNNDFAIYFDIINGVVGSSIGAGVTGAIQNVGNGWFRCSVIRTTNAVTMDLSINPVLTNGGGGAYAGDITKGYFIWGAQFEVGTVASTYHPASLLPVAQNAFTSDNFIYVPSSYGEIRSFTQTPNIRNLVQQSETFDNAYWNKVNSTLVANNLIAPNGTLTADSLLETVTNTTHYIDFAAGLSVTVGATYTFSIYVKSNGRQWLLLDNFNNSIDYFAYFDIINGVIGFVNDVSITPAIQDVGNGWFRCSLTRTVTGISLGAATMPRLGNNIGGTYVGDVTKGVYIWGAQIERSAVISAYQRTVAVGDGVVDFSFTRATRSSVTNKLGIIEDSCYNLSPYSEDYTNAAWTKTVTTISTAQDLNPITRVNNVCKVLANTTSNTSCRIFNVLPNVTGQVTLTGYVKAFQNVPFIHVAVLTAVGTAATTLGACINTANGNITTGHLNGNPATIFPNTSSISIVNGYIFFTLTWNNATNLVFVNNSVYLSASSADTGFIGAVGDGIYLWGLQLVQGAVAKPYLRTTNRLNVPKLDYSRSLLEPSLLIEPARTNVCLQSDTFDNATWNKAGVTVIANAFTAPDSTSNADNIKEDSTNAGHFVYQSFTTVTGTTYTASSYVRKYTGLANTRRYGYFNLSTNGSVGNRWGIIIDLQTGLLTSSNNETGATPITNNTYKVDNYSNYWKVSIIGTINLSTSSFYSIGASDVANPVWSSGNSVNYIGDNLSTVTVWGAQVEIGVNATTYIPTTTASITRNTETNFVDLFNNAMLNANQYTLFWEGYLYDGQTTGMQVCLSDTNTAAANTNQVGWTGLMQPFYNVGTTRTNGTILGVNNTLNKFALQYNSGVANFFLNGENVWPNRVLSAAGYRYLVMNSGTATYATDKLAVFNRALTTPECIALTTNAVSLPAFVSTWNTNNTSAGSSTATQVKLPLVTSGLYGFVVDWGDGTSNAITVFNQAETTHTYAVAGTYQITIRGVCYGWQFANTGDRLKFMSVQNWGAMRISHTTTLINFFQGCSNLDLSSVVGVPDLTNVTNFTSCFGLCTSLTSINNFTSWNTALIANWTTMFNACTNYNQNIVGLNMIGSNNTSSMFNACTSFNNGLASGVTGSMHLNATFVNCANMFVNCPAFNQDIGSWNVSGVTNFTNFMSTKTAATYSTSNLDSIYNGWSSRPVTAGITITFGSAKYTAGATAGRAILTGAPNNWLITDGGI